MTTTHNYYQVSYTLLVDHPEMRGPTFKPVTAGHISHHRLSVNTLAEAVSLFNDIKGGSYDFSSECVLRVRVDRMHYNPKDDSYRPHTCRKAVEMNDGRATMCFLVRYADAS